MLKKTFRENLYFVFVYGFFFAAFLWPLLTLQKTLIRGDNWEQFYPWSLYYAECLHAGHLPYWTNLMACGFPLVAEGQIGAYYLIHLAVYFLLPFNVAYNWIVVFHVLFGGIGFYCYSRRVGLGKEGAVLSAVLFSFSSAYSGCFHNAITLRVLAWLPWALCVLDQLAGAQGKRRLLWIFVLGVIFSQMWTAGFAQLALYAMGYFLLFLLLEGRWTRLIDFFVACLISVLLALPQFAATLELIPVSVRAGESPPFALWGSLFPPALVSLVYPEWGSVLRLSFYIGILPLMFVVLNAFTKKSRPEKTHGWLALIFVALALGKYNPVYVYAIKKLSFTMLRSPTKFLFFATISLGFLAGAGFDKLLKGNIREETLRRFRRLGAAFVAAVTVLPGAGFLVFHLNRERLLDFSRRYAEGVYSQKTDPLHAGDYYYRLARQALDRLGGLFSYADAWNWWVMALGALSLAVILAAFKKSFSKKSIKFVVPAIVFVDLLTFGYSFGVGFVNNLGPVPAKIPESLVASIKMSQRQHHTVAIEWVRDFSDEIIPPDSNFLYGIAHAGGYSSLLVKRYYELAKELGFSDSSLGRHPYSESVWIGEKGVLDALGVGQVISKEKLTLPGLHLQELVSQSWVRDHHLVSERRMIYENASAAPLVYAVYDWKTMGTSNERLKYLKGGGFQPLREAVIEENAKGFNARTDLPATPAEIISQSDTIVTARIETLSDAIIIFRSVYYPRWKAEVDGKKRRLVPVDHAFCGLFVHKGDHRIRFFYDDRFNKRLEWLAMGGWFVLIIGSFYLLSIHRTARLR